MSTPTTQNRGFSFLPSTTVGWWGLGLFVFAFVARRLVPAVGMGAHLMNLGGLGLFVASAILAVWAVAMVHDRALVLLIPIASGVFWALFIVGEVVIGHA